MKVMNKTVKVIAAFILWALAIMTLAGVILAIFKDQANMFAFCDKVMFGIADITGWSYEESCVYVNIWDETLLCVITALLPFIPLVRSINRYGLTMPNSSMIVIISLYVLLIVSGSYYYLEPYAHMSIVEQIPQ